MQERSKRRRFLKKAALAGSGGILGAAGLNQISPRIWREPMVFELNREPSSNACYTPELESFFADRGGRFSGSWPHHPEPRGHRVVFKR